MSRVRLREGVRFRKDEFGGVCYVPHRDDFFALSQEAFSALNSISKTYKRVTAAQLDLLSPFIRVGMAECDTGAVKELAFSGPAFIGAFPELPTVTSPLVVNCFTTAWCPLLCKYCHADDLMTAGHRAVENDTFIDNVLATATAIPAMVAVITGGDPVTRPERALRLIEGLATSKSLVLDTSGAGAIDSLIPALRRHKVHVRVSLDSAFKSLNDSARPVNPKVVARGSSSWDAAKRTILQLLENNIAVSVQTVVTSENDRIEEWRELRDLLIEWGVKHWVLHVVVSGGKARRRERQILTQRRPRQLRPSGDIGKKLAALVHETIAEGLPIDVRCTDTDDRPNSVLLVASNGDLYTEGYAKKGKVKLFEAGAGRPDKIHALMAHLDRFGHARRYLNWNPWFAGADESIENLCIPFVGTPKEDSTAVETEFKLRVTNLDAIVEGLLKARFKRQSIVLQRDEYFDDLNGFAAHNDYVIRLRTIGQGEVEAAFKGPRFFSEDGASSRLEFEVPTVSLEVARAALLRKNLRRTWFLEKRRTEYEDNSGVRVSIDEIPLLGFFVEIEGPLAAARRVLAEVTREWGTIERKNYKELAVAEYAISHPGHELQGLEFDVRPPIDRK